MPAARAASDAILAAASGWAKRRAASDIVASRERSRNREATSFTRRSLESSDCGNKRAAPPSASIAAFWLWWSSAALGKGMKRSEEHTSELQSRQYLVC